MYKKFILFLLLGMGCVNLSRAGGFKLGLQGVKQIGMGHTGVGFAQDAATIYFNPAGMSFIDNQFNLGINFLAPSTTYLDYYTNETTLATGNVYTPFSIYAKGNLSKKIAVGLGVYTPFGSGMNYPYEWTGRFVLTNINLNSFFIQPSLALKLSPKMSLGFGYIIAAGKVVLEKDLPLQSYNTNEYAHAKLEGNAGGNGYNLGLYYNNHKKFQAGITYHSKVTMAVKKGEATFSGVPTAASASFPYNNTFKTDLTLPSELAIGFSEKISQRVTAAFDFNYTYWKSYDYLSFDYGTNTALLTDSKSPRLYKNAWAIRGGLQAHFPKNVDVRVGAFYDKTPVQDGYVAPELPDNNKLGLTAGITYYMRKHFRLDASVLYENVAKREELNKESNMRGTYKTNVICPGIGVSYFFSKKEKIVKRYKRRY